MSSPDTNLDKQTRRHRGPLIGFVICAAAIVAFVVFYVARDEVEEDAAADQVPATTADSD